MSQTIATDIPYGYALKVADTVIMQLRPYCVKIAFAGSLRRHHDKVGDIEICFTINESNPFNISHIKNVFDQWESIKGDSVEGRYTQRIHESGIKIDFFKAYPDNWGLIFAIRTGSDWFSHNKLASNWSRQGYHSVKGFLRGINSNDIIPLKTEIALFELLGMTFVRPQFREEKYYV